MESRELADPDAFALEADHLGRGGSEKLDGISSVSEQDDVAYDIRVVPIRNRVLQFPECHWCGDGDVSDSLDVAFKRSSVATLLLGVK